jgi:thiamine-monophosphate kinase
MSADEFDVIRTLFAPLATSTSARGLVDDAAVLETRGKLIVTTDAIVEGVHFLPDDPIDTVAKKALRVNLSDLAAKGAKCVGVLLTLVWPDARPATQITAFASGLAEDLRFFEIPLLGGDTTSTPGPLTVSITAFGEPLGARTPSRADAKVGDDVWITGTIGDAWVGLEALIEMGLVSGAASLAAEYDACIARYRVPELHGAAELVAAHASAAMDVSDGLLQDAGKLAAASNVRLRIAADDVPLSAETKKWLARSGGALSVADALAGGDDYEILFTASPANRAAIITLAESSKLPLTRVGAVEAGEGVALIDHSGNAIETKRAGYSHKLGK